MMTEASGIAVDLNWLNNALRPVATQYRWLMQVLLEFDHDGDGKFAAPLRRISNSTDMPLSTVQKYLGEMESLGFFKRSRAGGGVYVYQRHRGF